MQAGIKNCSVCGKEAGFGSVVVLHYGRGGRVHKTCLAVGKEVRLADGTVYRRPREALLGAGKGVLSDGGKEPAA